MYRGYVKMWRKSIDGGWLSNANLWLFWCYCLMSATHKKCKVLKGFKQIDLEPGEFIFSRRKVVKMIGLSEQSVRTCLQALKSTHNLTIKTTHRYSIISIVNWELYQGDSQETNPLPNPLPNQQLTHCQPTPNPLLLVNKNDKNEKKEKKKRLAANAQAKRRCQLPSDFTLTDQLIQFATDAGISPNRVEQVFSHFCDYHRAKGSAMLDWPAAWRTWVRNDQKFSRGKTPPEDIPGFDWSKPKYLPPAPSDFEG